MRIPSAGDYLGQRIAQVIPSDDVESARALALSKGKSDTDGIIAAKEIEKIGNIGIDIGLEEYRHEEKLKTIKELKQAQDLKVKEMEFKKAQKEKEHSELQTKIINYKSAIDDAAYSVFNDENIADDQKLTELERKSAEIKTQISDSFGDKAHVLEPVHAEAMFKAKDSLQNLQIKKLNDESRASVMIMVDALEKKAAKSPQDRQEAIAMIEAADLTGYSEQERQKIKQGFKEKTAINEIANRINSKDFDSLLSDLKANNEEGDPVYFRALDPKDREHFIGTIQNSIEHEKRQKEAARKAAEREWKQDVRDALSDYKEAKLSGLPINPKDEIMLYKMVKGTEFEKKFDSIKSKGESFAFVTEKLSKDPLTFGAARLGISVEPINLTDTANLPQQLQERLEIGKKVKAFANLAYTPVLKTDEVKGLADLLKKQQSGSIQTIQQLTNVIGKDGMMGIAQQIAADSTQTGMIIAFTVQGKTDIANAISEGKKYIKEKVIKMPKDNELRDKYDSWIKDSFMGLPETNDAHYEAFKSYYASQAARKGITDGFINQDAAKGAFKAVVGEIVGINGKKVVIPEDYTESMFKNSIKLITAESIKQMGGVSGLTNEDAANVIKDDAQWFATSQQNTYRVVVNGKYMLTPDGNYVQFRFSGKEGFTMPSKTVTTPAKKKNVIESD